METNSIIQLAGFAAILGFLWSLHRDIGGLHRGINDVHRDISDLHHDIGDLRERIARLEGLFEGFINKEKSAA